MNQKYGTPDSKVLLASGLATLQRELTAVMMYVGSVWGDASPAEIMTMHSVVEQAKPVWMK